MELQGEEALDYLNNRYDNNTCYFQIHVSTFFREMTLGGYSQQITLFHPLPTEEGIAIAPFPVLVFVASPNSGPYWLGPASSSAIADQVSQ